VFIQQRSSRCHSQRQIIENLAAASADACAELATRGYIAQRAAVDVQPVMTSRASSDRQLSSNKIGGPRLARWLKAEMERRGHMTVNRLHVVTDLDRKTIKRMLAGKRVSKIRIKKLAAGLSQDGSLVAVCDVPTD
jgi:hypothetical protein